MKHNLEDKDRRREQAYERLETRQPQCQHCTESDPFALQGTHPDIACYECSAHQAGKSNTERHHPAGRRNSPVTVAVPGNDHRVLNDAQNDWPKRTLRNPDESPLLKAAAAIRGWLDILKLIIERVVGWIPVFLESLDEALRARYGDRWWEELGLEGVRQWNA
jgi:hypothetical protein